jgi:hypothetical protein
VFQGILWRDAGPGRARVPARREQVCVVEPAKRWTCSILGLATTDREDAIPPGAEEFEAEYENENRGRADLVKISHISC